MVFKSLQGLAPDYLGSKFVNRVSAYCLGDSEHKLNVLLLHTNVYKNSAVLWNSLPLELRKAKSLNQFKQLVKDAI